MAYFTIIDLVHETELSSVKNRGSSQLKTEEEKHEIHVKASFKNIRTKNPRKTESKNPKKHKQIKGQLTLKEMLAITGNRLKPRETEEINKNETVTKETKPKQPIMRNRK